MVLIAYDAIFADHDPGPGHPECPARVRAVEDALRRIGVTEAEVLAPRDATDAEITRVHTGEHVATVSALAESGGGYLDADTGLSAPSWDVAVRAAGAGLAAVDALVAQQAPAAFCAVRPPGHHALAARGMGFCLLNNIAIAAAHLTARGDRVLVLDWDAHHGNGTQDIFYEDPKVLYVSMHQWPLYPGTGRLDEAGSGPGLGATCNLPLPAGATGDVYLAAMDDVVAPLAQRFAPDWVLVSAGFDGHRADPLTGLALSAGDFADLTARSVALGPRGRTVMFLEGGYDLRALADSIAASLGVLTDQEIRPEAATTGGPGTDVVEAAEHLHLAR